MSRCSRSVRNLLLLALVGGGLGAPAYAHELDHYSCVPELPLADLGPYYTKVFYENLADAVSRTNDRIRAAVAGGDRRAVVEAKSPDAIVHAFIAEFPTFLTYIGDVEAEVHSPRLMQRYPGAITAWWPQPCIFEEAYFVLSLHKFYLAWRSSLINMFGVYVGTDKFGHFVHNGKNYYDEYRAALRGGADDDQAMARAIALGNGAHPFFSERTALGRLTSGAMSNADLAANYLGLKFLRNLYEEVMLEGRRAPALLVREGDLWRINAQVRPDSDFLRPYFPVHYDEVLNPNMFDAAAGANMNRAVGRRRGVLRLRYVDENGTPRPPTWFAQMLAETRTYYGESYGYIPHEGAVVNFAELAWPTCSSPADRAARALHAAAGAGDRGGAEQALRSGTAPDALISSAEQLAFERGMTALHYAAQSGQREIVALLLGAGANVRAANGVGMTALHHAADVAGLPEALLGAGADVNACDAFGRTPLHCAVRAGRTAVVQGLLRAGANPNVPDLDGETPLHAAARRPQFGFYELLAGAGADPRARDALGRTPDMLRRSPARSGVTQ